MPVTSGVGIFGLLLLPAALLPALGVVGDGRVARSATKPKGVQCWVMVAASDIIAEGTLASAGSGTASPGTMQVERWLKGKGDTESLLILNRVATTDARLEPGKPVVAFLQKPADAGPYYVTEVSEDGCKPLMPYSTEYAATVTHEVNRQGKAVASFADVAAHVPRDSAYRQVKDDVESMVRSDPAKAFRRLVGRGEAVIPSLILLLDDARPLAEGSVEVRSSGFEARAHYTPKTVFDAVDLALQELTGVSFDTLGGKRPTIHERVLAGWKIYLTYLPSQPLPARR